MSPPDDQQLLAAARAGDGQALEELLARHQAQAYRFGLRMCRDPEEAKDVMQDTLLAMARSVRDFRGASSLSTWLYSIARSFCVKKRRRAIEAEGAAAEVEAEALPDASRGPDEALAGKQVERVLEVAIGALEPGHREVLVLRDVEGLSAAEVAEVLGLSVEAVKSRLHRARRQVRDRVGPLLGVEGGPPKESCPDVLALYSQKLEGEIDAGLCAQLERHLETCARCRDTCDSLKRTLAMCRAGGPAVQVPAAVQESVRRAVRSAIGLGP